MADIEVMDPDSQRAEVAVRKTVWLSDEDVVTC